MCLEDMLLLGEVACPLEAVLAFLVLVALGIDLFLVEFAFQVELIMLVLVVLVVVLALLVLVVGSSFLGCLLLKVVLALIVPLDFEKEWLLRQFLFLLDLMNHLFLLEKFLEIEDLMLSHCPSYHFFAFR